MINIFNNFYIKEMIDENELFDDSIKLPSFLKKLTIKFFKLTNILIIRENIIILPYSNKELTKISDKKFNTLFKKIHKFLNKENIKTIAISNSLNRLNNIGVFKNLFFAHNYNILDGRWLFKHLSFEILEYISKQFSKPLNELEVSILTNETSEFIKANIKVLAQNIKNLNIVTSNIEYFKPLTQELYNAFGISIRLSNNKRKILTNSNVIFNFDFPEEILNKFTLPLNGFLINYNDKIKIHTKLFNGLNINYYTIDVHKRIIEDFNNIHLLDSFNIEILYESLYFHETSFTKMLTHFIDDSLIITSLQGNKGKLSAKEYKFF